MEADISDRPPVGMGDLVVQACEIAYLHTRRDTQERGLDMTSGNIYFRTEKGWLYNFDKLYDVDYPAAKGLRVEINRIQDNHDQKKRAGFSGKRQVAKKLGSMLF